MGASNGEKPGWAIGHAKRRRIGISLLELLIVICIMLILMSMILAVLGKVYKVVESWR
ncbi:MAG TPA: hypothetical protein VH518_21675 [Tepidisphaeraceae bacterium]|jgi:type II secretory pathway pseudopilin PulG